MTRIPTPPVLNFLCRYQARILIVGPFLWCDGFKLPNFGQRCCKLVFEVIDELLLLRVGHHAYVRVLHTSCLHETIK
jgi:hypothetical protein